MMPIDAYARLGDEGIERLVERIYHWMAELPEAGPAMRLHHPDMSEVKRRLTAFLSGWLGGPDRFRPAYGEPFMRRRHMGFPIGNAERDAWMAAFRRALDEVVTDPALHGQLLSQFLAMAEHLRNRADGNDGPAVRGCHCATA
jgi:hemoglobin